LRSETQQHWHGGSQNRILHGDPFLFDRGCAAQLSAGCDCVTIIAEVGNMWGTLRPILVADLLWRSSLFPDRPV
jgi:hypothetical protein